MGRHRSRYTNRLTAVSRLTPQATVPAFIDSALVPARSGLAPTAAVKRLADDMRQGCHREGGVTEADLLGLGWTASQLKTLGADARALAQQLARASL